MCVFASSLCSSSASQKCDMALVLFLKPIFAVPSR